MFFRGKRVRKLALAALCLGLLVVYLNAALVFNDPTSPFPAAISAKAGDLIIDAASQLLQSSAAAFNLANEIEMAEKAPLRRSAALAYAEKACRTLRLARLTFQKVITVGQSAGYEMGRLHKLMDFDYALFAQENNLNGEVMNRLSAFLAKGDVLGYYRQTVNNQEKLLSTLERIVADLKNGLRPSNDILWSTIQQYNELLLWGNYATLVFYQL